MTRTKAVSFGTHPIDGRNDDQPDGAREPGSVGERGASSVKSTVIDENGDVRCPVCGAKNSFTAKRTGKAKLIGGATVGVGALLAPKRLRCNGCGTNLKAADPVEHNLERSAARSAARRDELKSKLEERRRIRNDESRSAEERGATYGNPLDRWFAKRRFERQAATKSEDQ